MHARARVHKNSTGVGFGTSWLVNTSISKEAGAPWLHGDRSSCVWDLSGLIPGTSYVPIFLFPLSYILLYNKVLSVSFSQFCELF